MSFWDWFWQLAIWLPLVILWTATVIDVLRRGDLSGAAKALWLVGIFVFPWIGVLVYVVARPRDVPYWSSAPTVGSADLERMARLKEQGYVSGEEYDRYKQVMFR